MLYLHAGTVKTGTTYIQKIMHENKDIMQKYGLKYLPVAMADLELPRYANAKFLYDYSFTANSRLSILEAHDNDVLVSEEGIWGYANHLLNPIFEGVPKKIILYLRPTADALGAWASEHCHPYNVLNLPDNQGFHATNYKILSIEETIDVLSREYAISMGRIIDVIDSTCKEDFIIKPYEVSSMKNGDLLSDFLSIINLDEGAIRAEPNFKNSLGINVSGTRKYCDISRITWDILGRPNVLDDFHYGLVTEITRMCTSGDSRPVVETLSNEQISSLTDRFEWVERYFSRHFFANQSIFSNRYPKCFGVEREPYRPVDPREVELLIELLQMRKAM